MHIGRIALIAALAFGPAAFAAETPAAQLEKGTGSGGVSASESWQPCSATSANGRKRPGSSASACP